MWWNWELTSWWEISLFFTGGLVCRGILSTLSDHNVHSFISLSSPQAGQYGGWFKFKSWGHDHVSSCYNPYFCYFHQRGWVNFSAGLTQKVPNRLALNPVEGLDTGQGETPLCFSADPDNLPWIWNFFPLNSGVHWLTWALVEVCALMIAILVSNYSFSAQSCGKKLKRAYFWSKGHLYFLLTS